MASRKSFVSESGFFDELKSGDGNRSNLMAGVSHGIYRLRADL